MLGASALLFTTNQIACATSPDTTPKTYYVATNGSDLNDGLSPTQPFKTIAKINTITSLLQPGDQVLLHAGQRFTDDYIRCQNLVVATAGTTLANTPPQCSGTSAQPVTFGRYGTGYDPILDAADGVRGLVWRSLGNGVYSSPIAAIPQKLYIDTLSESSQLIPVPNFVGNYDNSGGTTYQPWDSVLDPSTNTYQMNGSNTPQTNTLAALGLNGAWTSPYLGGNAAPGQTSQTFIPTNTGLQNVQAIGGGSITLSFAGGTGYPDSFTFSSIGGGFRSGVPCEVTGSAKAVNGVPVLPVTFTENHGCQSVPTIIVNAPTGSGLRFYGHVQPGSFFYASTSQNGVIANEIYVHLPDGSDPSNHRFFATHRPYGVLLRSVNNVVVSHLQFAHQLKSGILSYPFTNSTLAGNYWTNENIQISHATCWNTGDTAADTLGWQNGTSRTAVLEGCVVLRASGENSPHLVRGNAISDSWSGTIDTYYGLRGDTLHANFIVSGVDGTQTINGTTTSYPVIQYSFGRSQNSACIRYVTTATHMAALALNKGGIVSNNECTSNASGNIFFGATEGGRVSYNYIHNSLGEGIQGGGNSTSVPDNTSYQAQVFDHNVLSNLGYSASMMLYNGIDVNNGAEGPSAPYTKDLHIMNNSLSNVAAACVTLEANIVAAHVHDNVCLQNAKYFPTGWICPICADTTNYAAGIFTRNASVEYPTPMDWHNNAFQGQGVSQKYWGFYNLQNVGANRGSCFNLETYLQHFNSNSAEDTSSFCLSASNLARPSANNLTLLPSSPLRNTGTNGGDIGAVAFGDDMFPTGPRAN